jgi:RNA polymerase sigma-70 factor (ECF subfamily)
MAIDGQAEDRLVERARNGDGEAFAAIYDDLAPQVLRFLCHQVGSPDRAEELMQRTFVKVIEALPQFEPRRGVPFRAWVFRVARNLSIDEHRTAHPAVGLDAVVELPTTDPGPEQAVEAAAEREELLAALERLPPDMHDVIVYRFFGGLSPAETAALVHKSEGSVRVTQHRALGRLRRMLTPAMLPSVAAGARP